MQPSQYFGVTSQQVMTHACHVLKIEGTFLGTTADRYLQVHDSKVAPAALAVPLRQWPIAQNSPFLQTFVAGELSLTAGLYVCVSTTDGTYTLSADTMDLTVETTDPEQPSGTTYVGDLTSSVTNLQVWADAAGPKKLMSLEVDGSGLAGDKYIMGFAIDAPSAGAVPVWQKIIKAGQVLTGVNALRFGTHGRDMQSIDATGLHDGCTVFISNSGSVLQLGAGRTVKMKAEYK